MTTNKLEQLARLIRYYCLVSTTTAGSGHATSSLSAVELMTALLFGGVFKADLNKPDAPNNDRLIFSKGHASPLFYALFAAAGKVSEKELLTLRTFGSKLEGHPTMAFRYTEAATGSLGQGLSVGVGMALNAKYLDRLPYTTYVLLGDSEMTEGSVWEAMQLAAHYKLNNLVGIIDVNALGQRGQTMYGHDVTNYAKKVTAFGWQAIVVDGHDVESIGKAYAQAKKNSQPTMIIAKTIKGKGVSFLENQGGWHGKALSKEELPKALAELGVVDKKLVGKIAKPSSKKSSAIKANKSAVKFDWQKPLSTRKAYGIALANLGAKNKSIVALDAEVSNSTFADIFAKEQPKRFFEMFIAEQNMVGAALGLSARGKKPFVSTFAAFFTRAFDQLRMAQYSKPNIAFVGSHAGVSIGEDGASQMGLEDIALFRTLFDSVVLYPSDAVATKQLVDQMATHKGLSYLRTTRMDLPVIYKPSETFSIGGSKVLRSSSRDALTLVAAGVTLHQALEAAAQLAKDNIAVRVIDLYSIKPIDKTTLIKAASETKHIVTVEDHGSAGGLGEAVASVLAGTGAHVTIKAVTKVPRSGTAQELLDFEGISAKAIVVAVKKILKA